MRQQDAAPTKVNSVGVRVSAIGYFDEIENRRRAKGPQSVPKRVVARGSEYYEYLRSAEWRAVKDRYLSSRLPNECYVCRAPWNQSFHFHHKTYKNLGKERLMDIAPVCPQCHDRIHDYQRRTGFSLWEATSRQRRWHAKSLRRPMLKERGEP